MDTPGKQEGAVYSANFDGTSVKTVIASGQINTPKQLALDAAAQNIYFCDREDLRVYRCSFDGSDLEILVSAGNQDDPLDAQDGTK